MCYALNISTPSTKASFPWNDIDTIAQTYGLNPIVLNTKASNNTLFAEIDAGRPCIVAMDRGEGKHAVVLRGYSTLGNWSIWNPWFENYENYSISGSYVPTGYSAADYSYVPYKHAYNFG